jgi:aspartate racemase
MEEDFYTGRLEDRFGLNVLVPDLPGREVVHRIIYEELCAGRIVTESRNAYVDICNQLVDQGAEAIILGCTEIGLLIKASDLTVPVYDTTMIHCMAAAEEALD